MAQTMRAALDDKDVAQAEPLAKSYKISDGGGMFLEVMPNGSKLWRLKYRFGKKESHFRTDTQGGRNL